MSQQINLFNPVFMKQRKYFSAVTMLQGLVLIALGSALFYGYAGFQIKSLTDESTKAKQLYVAEQARLERYKSDFSPEESSKLLDSDLKLTEKKLAIQLDLISRLKGGAIGNTTGYSGYMRAFARQAVTGLWLSDFEIVGDGARISLSGSVLSPDLLPAYIRRLNQEPAMRGKSFAALQMRMRNDNSGAVEFALQSSETGGAEK